MSSNYIRTAHTKNLTERKEFLLYGSINIFIKDPLPEEVGMTNVIQDIEDTIPRRLLHEVETIIVGQFSELNDRGVRAVYMDGGIYVTNEQPSEEQLFEDIVHEIAHAVEKMYEYELYADKKIESEYLAKKKRFLDTLTANGVKVPNRIRVGTEYSKMFDEFLYYELGYEKATNHTIGLFLSPYSAVSISEYFATAFEHYFVQEGQSFLKQLCPVLYSKLEYISDEARGE